MTSPSSIRARLFYNSTCPPCQWMSKLAVMLALGAIRRVPLTGEEARQLYQAHPGREGQLMLQAGQRVVFGRRVFAEVPRCILRAWWHLLRFPFISLATYAPHNR